MIKNIILVVFTILLFSCKKEKAEEVAKTKQKVEQKAVQKITIATIGKPSPEFINYENYDGSKTSLKDLKGKYVYIDVWATWCGPCRREIPFLQKLEKAFEGKNIAFVSISVDRANAYSTWKKMIADNKMGGIQLFAGNDKSFVTAYRVNSIPRFILIDPNGNTIATNATRPSQPQTKVLLEKLLN